MTNFAQRSSALLVLALAFELASLHADPPQLRQPAGDFRISISVSPFSELRLSNGVVFTDGQSTAKTPEELQALFAAHGANEVYARIATTQKHAIGSGDHSMDRGLSRARMAKSMQLPFNPELGLFRVYGDIRCQPAPEFGDYPEVKLAGTWNSLNLDQMRAALRAYGTAAARQILSTGVSVRIWDLGNEVEFGTAGVAVRPLPGGCDETEGPGWYKPPDGVDPAIGKMSSNELLAMPTEKRLAWLRLHLWPCEARLLAAVAEGIRTADPDARFSTHVSGISAALPEQAVAFYKAMNDGGFRPDELGVSYYPTSSAQPADRLQAFKYTVQALHRELGKPVFVSEFAYPTATMERVFVWNNAVKGYPQTVDGQAKFLRDLAAWGAGTGLLSGIRPWAPDLAGTPWGPMAFFSLSNKIATARPALDAIAEGVRSALAH